MAAVGPARVGLVVADDPGVVRGRSGSMERYRDVVSAESAPPPRRPQSEGFPRSATPRAIREALLPEETGQFDSEWRTAMSRAAELLDLAEVYTVLERWRAIAALTQADPQAHRRMLQRAELVLTGQDRGTITADDMREMLAHRLG